MEREGDHAGRPGSSSSMPWIQTDSGDERISGLLWFRIWRSQVHEILEPRLSLVCSRAGWVVGGIVQTGRRRESRAWLQLACFTPVWSGSSDVPPAVPSASKLGRPRHADRPVYGLSYPCTSTSCYGGMGGAGDVVTIASSVSVRLGAKRLRRYCPRERLLIRIRWPSANWVGAWGVRNAHVMAR
jgi:hypothetical protein